MQIDRLRQSSFVCILWVVQFWTHDQKQKILKNKIHCSLKLITGPWKINDNYKNLQFILWIYEVWQKQQNHGICWAVLPETEPATESIHRINIMSNFYKLDTFFPLFRKVLKKSSLIFLAILRKCIKIIGILNLFL